MKNKNSTYRDAGFSLVEKLIVIALLGLLAAFALPQTAQAESDSSLYLNNTTNTVAVAGAAPRVNVVLANTTNYFNLSTTSGAQANTNLWPAAPLIVNGNVYNPSRIFTLHGISASQAANTGQFTERWAGSTDGSHWQTNPCPVVIVYTEAGTTGTQWMTNIDAGAIQYFCLYSRENTNAAVAITNTWTGTSWNRGL